MRRFFAVVLLVGATLQVSCSAGRDETPGAVRSHELRLYFEENADALVRDIQAMLPELEHGEVSRAQSRYARARVRYSQIELAAEAYPRLDERINARPLGGAPSNGFHAIERQLWIHEDTRRTVVEARRLLRAAKQLRAEIPAVAALSADRLALATSELLAEVVEVKLNNEEQVYADADLVDVSANLEAAGAVLAALRPVLDKRSRARLRSDLRRAYAAIARYGTPARDPNQPRGRSPGAIFTVFSELSPAEIEALRDPIAALSAAFSSARLAG